MSGEQVEWRSRGRAFLGGTTFQWALAVAAPIAVALLLIPGRNHLDSADDALVLVVVTVAIASGGSRIRAFAAAIVAAGPLRLPPDPSLRLVPHQPVGGHHHRGPVRRGRLAGR